MIKPSTFKRFAKLINLYPPFLGAGIRLKSVNEDGNRFVVSMKLRWYNRNVYGTHYGGSLYSMCDPFFVFAAYSGLGDDYIYWDKSASIKYLRPGKGTVTAVFEIPKEQLLEMKTEVDQEGKNTYTFSTTIVDEAGKSVAEVEKEIYIKKK